MTACLALHMLPLLLASLPAVDPHSFPTSMTLTCRVLIGPSSSPLAPAGEGMLVALVDGQTRGTRRPPLLRLPNLPVFEPYGGTLLFPLTVYGGGEEDVGKEVTFVWWKNSTTRVPLSPSLPFEPDGVVGKADQPFVLKGVGRG